MTTDNLGHDTNKSAEIWGMIRGVQLALDHNITCLIIEGYSKVIIELASKIINGRKSKKITPSQCLLDPLHCLQSLL